MYDYLTDGSSINQDKIIDDVFRWFARFLLEGKVFPKLRNLISMLNDSPAIITVSVKTVAFRVSNVISCFIMNRGVRMFQKCTFLLLHFVNIEFITLKL